MLLLEHPHISQVFAAYARHNGQYNRPIIGHMADLRTENMGLDQIRRERRLMNIIAKLPDIPEANQHDTYIVATFGSSELEKDPTKVQKLIASNQFLVLPDSPKSEFWQITGCPWWEYIEVLDEHGMPIKAALHSTTNFTPETIDEKLDMFQENQGKLEVLSPVTLEKMHKGEIKESYNRKLSRLLR